MNDNKRFAVGLDTSFLQAVDSYVNRTKPKKNSLEKLIEFDPNSREQFIEAIDVFVDLPPNYLIVPKEKIGFLAPIGKRIIESAIPLTDATESAPMNTVDGINYYSIFLKELMHDPEFQLRAIKWGWFQFSDHNVLLGYTTRMEFDKDLKFVKEAMQSEFEESFYQLNKEHRTSLINQCFNTMNKYDYSLQKLKLIIEKRKEHSSQELSTANELTDYMLNEINDYKNIGNKYKYSAYYYLLLFMLAYVGSVFRRGLQYAEVYTRKRDHALLTYLPHRLRGDYIKKSITTPEFSEQDNTRTFWWSWGNLLAKSIEERPTIWSTHKIIEVVEKLQKYHNSEQISISLDDPNPEEIKRRYRLYSESLRELALDTGIVVEYNDKSENFKKWLPVLVRNIPLITLTTTAEILKIVLNTPVSSIFTTMGAASAQVFIEACYGADLKFYTSKVVHLFEDYWLKINARGLRKVLSGGLVYEDIPIGPIALKGSWNLNQLYTIKK